MTRGDGEEEGGEEDGFDETAVGVAADIDDVRIVVAAGISVETEDDEDNRPPSRTQSIPFHATGGPPATRGYANCFTFSRISFGVWAVGVQGTASMERR